MNRTRIIGKPKKQPTKKNLFYLNLNDFNLFQLRSADFLINFPLSFTLAIFKIWQKIVTNQMSMAETFSCEEIDMLCRKRRPLENSAGFFQARLKSA